MIYELRTVHARARQAGEYLKLSADDRTQGRGDKYGKLEGTGSPSSGR
jgi:hypothetical protein